MALQLVLSICVTIFRLHSTGPDYDSNFQKLYVAIGPLYNVQLPQIIDLLCNSYFVYRKGAKNEI